MNKRIKKKYRDLQLDELCDSIVDTMTIKKGTVLIMRIDPDVINKYGPKIANHTIKSVIDHFKRLYDIDVVVAPKNFVFEQTDNEG